MFRAHVCERVGKDEEKRMKHKHTANGVSSSGDWRVCAKDLVCFVSGYCNEIISGPKGLK